MVRRKASSSVMAPCDGCGDSLATRLDTITESADLPQLAWRWRVVMEGVLVGGVRVGCVHYREPMRFVGATRAEHGGLTPRRPPRSRILTVCCQGAPNEPVPPRRRQPRRPGPVL